MKNKNKKINKGMTLIEILITVSIMGIVSSTLWVVLLQGFRMWRLHSAQTEVQRDARVILDLMDRNIRPAKAAFVVISRHPDAASTVNPPFSKITFIRLKAGTTVQVSYYQDGRICYQVVDGHTSRLTKNVRNLHFATVESGDSTVVCIGLCLEKETYDDRTRASRVAVQKKVRIMN